LKVAIELRHEECTFLIPPSKKVKTPADMAHNVAESARGGGEHGETVRVLVVRIHVSPILSAIHLEPESMLTPAPVNATAKATACPEERNEAM